MGSEKLVAVTSLSAAVIVLGSLGGLVYMVNDLNNFYTEAIQELSEFKVT